MWEETGFDLSPLIDPKEHIEVVQGEQRSRMFVVPGVDADTQTFACRTVFEIRVSEGNVWVGTSVVPRPVLPTFCWRHL